MRVSDKILRCVTKTSVIALLLISVILVSTSSIVYGEAHEQDSQAKQNLALAKFLAAPINLVAFKKKKGISNSGSLRAKEKRWFYKPKKTGFFYRYMLFPTPGQYSEGERFFGFSVIVYKFGRKIGDYNNTNEILTAIWCRLKDPDLGPANLVGKPVTEVKELFGLPFTTRGDVIIYMHSRHILSLHINDGIVDWFKYARLRRDINESSEVLELLTKPGFK